MYEVLENSKLSLEKQDQMLQIGIETKEEITGCDRILFLITHI
jgi:hypothetical protein